MGIILDTHILLWYLLNDKKLKSKNKEIISKNDKICISIASFWEIVIKLSLERLTIDISLDELFDEARLLNIEILPIHKNHLLELRNLPLHHRDPFDRLIISQAMSEKMKIITTDRIFKKYEVELLKN